MAQPLNIFISYGRKDARDLAIQLRDDLQAQGYRVWLDLDEIAGGASWSQNIETAIEACHLTLALMSHASYESQWCRAEQLRAIRKGKRVIPIRVQSDAEPPLHLEHMNHLDFSERMEYAEAFRDLLSDITAGQAFETATEHEDARAIYKQKRTATRTTYKDEKRNAPALRRHIRALRQEPWLKARSWWTYFLFDFVPLQHAINILESDEMRAPFLRGEALNTRWDKFVRLYFRPRTPDLYHAEGFRPATYDAPKKYAPVPVYLLFDLEAIIAHPDSRFSDGDPAVTKKTYKTPGAFKELPFEQIYHDSGFMPDERDEIMRARKAQVLIPDKLGLEALQLIWLRSPAEYDMLRHLLPANIWRRWRNKITTRTDQHVFNSTRPFVQEAVLLNDQAHIRMNPCGGKEACQPFDLRAVITYPDGSTQQWHAKEQNMRFNMRQKHPIAYYDFEVPHGKDGYTLEFYLDEDLAYANAYHPGEGVY
jgi:hypothetical protein